MGILKKVLEFWSRRSLKFWLAMGMLMTYCPIFICAVAGYFIYHQDIIQPLVEVSSKQRHVLQPLQSVRITLWDAENSLIDYAIDGEALRVSTYRKEADEINTSFANLLAAVQGHRDEVRDVNSAWESWQDVTALSNDILSHGSLQGKAKVGEKVKELEEGIDRLSHRLETVYEDVRVENERTHTRALVDLGRTERLAIAGFCLSILFGGLGVLVINRSLVSSMNELATGAMRLAGGDRNHHIKVHIPHELANVADAFNQMTNQILDQEEALAHAARTDGLTGLWNRREFDQVLADEIQRADRYGAPFSLILGDIDHFKSYNDTYGHQAGDEVLRFVAKVFNDGLRDVDKAFRYGGEEFLVILTQCDEEAASHKAERLRTVLESQEVQLGGGDTAHVTISLGVATHPAGGTTPESLLRSADEALYKSKENGRNQVTSAGSSYGRQECGKSPQNYAPNLSASD